MMDQSRAADDPLGRFRFNLLMTLGLLWIVVSGGCTAVIVLGRFVVEQPVDRLTLLNFPLDWITPYPALLLFPGAVLWALGKAGAGYDGARDLRGILWRVPQAIGIAGAILLWVLGSRYIAWTIDSLWLGYCFQYDPYCSHVLAYEAERVLSRWAPGWVLYWMSTRP